MRAEPRYGTQSKSGPLRNPMDALTANPVAQRNFNAVAVLLMRSKKQQSRKENAPGRKLNE